MNLVEDFIKVKNRIASIEQYLNNKGDHTKNNKALDFMLEALGESQEQLEIELEGLKITESWLEDMLELYVEERGLSLEKNLRALGINIEDLQEK